MNLPNKITVFRILMIPFFVACMLIKEIPYHEIIAGVIFIIAALSDLVDGKIARRFNLVTNFGKFMDPLADKLLVQSALLCFVANGLLPAWIAIVIMSREFIISGFRLVAADKGIVIAAGYLGKLKTVFQMVMSVMLIFHFSHPVWLATEQIFIWGSLILTIVSLIDYFIKNKDVLKETK
ncbi:CDP-diacylglycerol--glycerol-3-phosphate 3-phosphatidyltransferase [Catonella massiliensis]|jgi:CDP-diacylglycerol--glycerol-3-phosphate 3-phosphatidyltransferase|uniref:CDP-diacylglycerol--glycerol-3-phosphate 3-phosphatidyltransferase n=1 Tax=Catonella massiliensis TaxID=2799636 RepID=A0ABS1IZX9_9FIRM|nr:CDP-diacylglycerol--glycerol-3-phosphate 3-phosphatidyltransferase [Catonella massiliensis]MBK5897239.1 CDP-diacylglycerol--glycerol-3-phosphate 3-phosphatidyltransferase [Catonella massiliensis]